MFLSRLLFVLGGSSLAFAKVQLMGINLSGLEFGCSIEGVCSLGSAQNPNDATGQIAHFISDSSMNIFRFPVSWQFLTNNKIGSALDSSKFGQYDALMQNCLKTGSTCAIDIHNYARVDGKIIGQGGPTDAQFADFWGQLASKYAGNAKVVFGLMNEPHDLDVPTWANTVQAAVTAIRNAGATSQMILLPGTNFASAGQFVGSGSAAALAGVSNPGGGKEGLVMDLHKYLDVDNSGEHAVCTTDNVDAFTEVATFLRTSGRVGMVSETGAGSDATCLEKFCAQNKFLNDNSDVFLGYVAWGAGSFSTDYVLSLTPSKVNGKYVDKQLATQCVVAPFTNAGAAIVPPLESAASSAQPTTTITQFSTRSRISTVVVGTQTVTQSSSTVSPSLTATPKVIPSSGGIFFNGEGGNKTVAVGTDRLPTQTATATGGRVPLETFTSGASKSVGNWGLALSSIFATIMLY